MKFYNSTIFKFAFCATFICCASFAGAQNNVNSVYSRFGLGFMENPGTVNNFGMGGLTTSVSDAFIINFANPASYSFLDYTVLQVAAKGGVSKSRTETESMSNIDGQINEIAIGFKKPGRPSAYTIGISPFSTVNYNFNNKTVINDSLTSTASYKGSGGLNKVVIGTSRLFKFYTGDTLNSNTSDSSSRVMHQLSIGINANYVFGTISRQNVLIFNNTENFSTVNSQDLWSQGFIFEGALIYKVPIASKMNEKNRVKSRTMLQLGFDYMLNGNLYAEYSELSYSVRFIGNTGFRDTALIIAKDPGRLKIPQRISMGVSFKTYQEHIGTIVYGVDYKLQDWSRYQLTTASDANLDDGLKSATTISAGLEYKPIADANAGVFSKLTYRAGYRITETALVIEDTRVNQSGISAGISIPIIRQAGRIHFGAEFGKTGTIQNGLVEEKYSNFMVGISLNPSSYDRWFRRVKYD